jgi:hypothetical protein
MMGSNIAIVVDFGVNLRFGFIFRQKKYYFLSLLKKKKCFRIFQMISLEFRIEGMISGQIQDDT